MSEAARALPIIRPITDMRTKFNEVCAQATEEQEPIILTKNGQASYLFIDKNAYEAQQRANRVRMALREAEIEEKYHPAAISEKESKRRMSDIFSALGITYA